MSIYIPYVYCIRHRVTGMKYIGSRTGKKANPADLLVKYFTSSKIVKAIIAREGKDCFAIEWILEQETVDATIALEASLLHENNAAKSLEFYNCTNGDAKFNGTKAVRLRVEAGLHHLLKQNGGSERSRAVARARIERGTHNWQGGVDQRQINKRRMQDGTHHFLDPEFKEKMRIISKQKNAERVEQGRHNFTSDMARRRNSRLLKEGAHIFQHSNPNKVIVACPRCGKEGGRGGMIRWHFDNCKLA